MTMVMFHVGNMECLDTIEAIMRLLLLGLHRRHQEGQGGWLPHLPVHDDGDKEGMSLQLGPCSSNASSGYFRTP